MATYLAIRDLDPETDPEAANFGAPSLPQGWTIQRVETAPVLAWNITGPSGETLIALRGNVYAGRGIFALRGPESFLGGLNASEVAPAREVWRKAQEGPGMSRNVVRAWPWARVDVTERATQADVDNGDAAQVDDLIMRDGVVRKLFASDGGLLPNPALDPFPWDLTSEGVLTTPQLAVIRVRAYLRPAYPLWTIAGYQDGETFENEPDREI